MTSLFVAIGQDIMNFFMEYSLEAGVIALIVTVCFAARFIILKEYTICEVRRAATRLTLVFLLIFYLYILLAITILSRSETPTREMSFELFRTFKNTFQARKQIFENLIMFMPLAVILFLLSPELHMWKIYLLSGLVGSTLIEIIQWLTMTGHFELDDIWLNTLGMMIGYGVCLLVERMVVRKRKAKK